MVNILLIMVIIWVYIMMVDNDLLGGMFLPL